MAPYKHVQIFTSILIITSLEFDCLGYDIPELDKNHIRPAFFDSKHQYICHCTQGCDSSGNCIGFRNVCDRKWFGLACQHQNLAHLYNSKFLPQDAWSLFTSRAGGECQSRTYMSMILVTWNMSLPFSWMRFQVGNTLMLDTLNVIFRKDGNETSIPCINKKLLRLNENTFDLRCDLYTTVKEIQIEGDIVKHMCFIRINGGRNFALQQKTFQSTQHDDWNANYAVDGIVRNQCDSDCSHTRGTDPHPSWTVTFDHPYNITRFVIYNRFESNSDRLKKFDLEAFNSEGHTVIHYQDETIEIQQVYTVFEPYVEPISGVTIRQRHKCFRDIAPIVTINEFEAYGECLDGTWGLGCNNTCDGACQFSCNKDDGTCNAVCIPNTIPLKCVTACPDGSYGVDCSQTCSAHCFESYKCQPVNGDCYYGCKNGYVGSKCNDTCPDGSYGVYCSQTCSAHCFQSYKCQPVNGDCYNGCKDGYVGSNCNDTCPDGSYGIDCSQTCSVHCFQSYKCQPVNGYCYNGCKVGYVGSKCNDICPDGSYGVDCLQTCSAHCFQSYKCQHVNGDCYNGCKDGYVGSNCNNTCPDGSYGVDCSQTCSAHCFESYKCQPVNGNCYNGCKNGYVGSKCNDTCPDGSYGVDCSQTCSAHCFQSYKCQPVYGDCYNGCKDGYVGSNCNDRNVSVSQHFPVSSLIVSIVATCSAIVLVIVIVWYVWRKKLTRRRLFGLEIKYQKDELISDNSTCITEKCN